MRFSVRWNVGQKRHVDPSALRNVSGMEFKPSWLFNQRFLRKLMVARRRRAKTSESISRFIDSLIVVCRRTFQGWLVDDEIGFQCHNSCRNGNQCFLHDRSDTIASTGSRDNPSLNGFFLASQKKILFLVGRKFNCTVIAIWVESPSREIFRTWNCRRGKSLRDER